MAHHGHASPHGAAFPMSPDNLQGASARSAPASGYGSQSAQPVPPLSTNFQPYEPPSRPTTMSTAHSYSRSSPAVGLDQKYTAFSHTPEHSRYPSSTSSKHFSAAQTPTTMASHSPLNLADIRPQPELHMNEELTSPGTLMRQEPGLVQTNSSYVAPWAIYAFDWCNWPVSGGNHAGKMAICSYLEDPHNFIQILDTRIEGPDWNNPSLGFSRVAEATCSYPVTRILWEPPSSQKQTTDLLATSGDHLRLWSLPPNNGPSVSNTIHRTPGSSRRQSPTQKLTPLALLSNSKTPEHTAPLTSLDWNQVSPKLIITSSIDTTCTIWDIPTLTAKTQLIAHDKEVFDVRFCAGSVDTFVSCGADGSVRMFDLRSLEHSTIIYEPSEKNDKDASPAPPTPTTSKSQSQTLPPAPPLLRIAASPHDSHLLATFASEANVIRVLDSRQPGQALLELHGHSGQINTVEWASNRRGMLASGADDCQVLCWDLFNNQNAANISGVPNGGVFGSGDSGAGGAGGGQGARENAKGPAASWRADYEVGNVSWSPRLGSSGGGDWLGVSGGRAVWGVRT